MSCGGSPEDRHDGSVRLRLEIQGVVQGVGFRPFVFRLATDLGLNGWVCNGRTGVVVEVEGSRESVDRFESSLVSQSPVHSQIHEIVRKRLNPEEGRGFEIRTSELGADRDGVGFVVPDIATCPDCLREILDPGNRRYRYPFTNCTHCGPRYSILEGLPYDRARTSMRGFRMCALCQAEYDSPADRRFHAQPNACPECGPRLEFWLPGGVTVATRDAALRAAADALRSGRIIAVKGIGGFHLCVAAGDEVAVAALRARKHRGTKPFALMFPSLEAVRGVCDLSALEEGLLSSAEAPIVLLRRRKGLLAVAAGVAPGNPNLGVMLPYSPLHHLLLAEVGFPVVATSGNLGDEPICTDATEALERLRGIADGFLVHDRPIVRSVDDSIVRVMGGRPLVLRRARGYAPSAVCLDGVLGLTGGVEIPRRNVLGVGAQVKSAVAISEGRQVYVGQHLGDLETPRACEAFRRGVADLGRLFGIQPSVVAVDGHPDYASTGFGRELGLPVVKVQHHYAHVLACLAENGIPAPALGVVWDGTGDGLDGTVWGGEFLRITPSGFRRIGRLRPFRLPGGEAAVREPRRTALGVLFEVFGEDVFRRPDGGALREFPARDRAILEAMVTRGLRSPMTSSAGRLFDAVASLLGLCQSNGFEGEAAMAVEFAADGVVEGRVYPFALTPWAEGGDGGVEVDWRPMVRGMLADLELGKGTGEVAAGFHGALVEMIVSVARQAGEGRVVLTGGCFQNRRLTERTLGRLREEGFEPVCHQWIPPNDGGIALGQVVAALREAE